MSYPIPRHTLAWTAAVLLLLTANLAAQEAQYTQEEYDAYTKAVEAGFDGILAFLKAHPESTLVQWAVPAYEQNLSALVEKGDHKAVVSAGEKFLNQVDAERFGVLYLTAWSAFHSQQFDKAAGYGEKTLDKQPGEARALVPIMARSYQRLDNPAKFVEWAERACEGADPATCYDLYPGLMKHFVKTRNWTKADAYAAKTIEALDKVSKPNGVDSAEWQEFVIEEKAIAYTVRGKKCFESQNWRCTQSNFNQLLKHANGNAERQAEAHYHLGMSYWNLKDIVKAMESFARGSMVQGSQFAKPCRTQLEHLYRSTHNDSLQGLEDYLATVSRT